MGGVKSTVSSNAAETGIKSEEDGPISSAVPQQKKWSASVAEPPQLPRTARTLLEVQLNPDAAPFAPKLDNLGVVGPQQDLPACQVAKENPEWMQYLAKKFEARKDATLASSPKKPTTGENQRTRQQTVPREKLKFGTRGQGPAMAAASSAVAASVSPLKVGIEQQGTGVVLHTSEYLRLLKDGGNKSKKIPSSSTIDRRSQGSTRFSASLKGLGLSQDRPEAPPLEAPIGQAGVGSVSEGDPNATTETLPLLASPYLAKLWSTALTADPLAKLPGDREREDGVDAPSVTQDDISVEKSRADMDLSQPDVYWSEDESFVRTRVRSWNRPSAHALGRRPRAAAADIRSYVMQDLSTDLDRLVALFLHRLQRFNDLDRTVFHPEGSSGKRYIIGLKEVVRRMKQQKVTHVIVAPDITENSNEGGLDDRMREIIALAYENEIPVVFALSRSRMGRAVGKSMHISLVGVVDATGARGLLDQAVRLSREQCNAWLARMEKATRQKTSPGAAVPSAGRKQQAAPRR